MSELPPESRSDDEPDRADASQYPVDVVALVADLGVVLESAAGAVPNLASLIAGEPIRGNWWTHPASHRIFAATRLVRDSEQVVTLRLVRRKVTFVHRRLWPALVRLSTRFPPEALAALDEEHTPSGRHVVRLVPFPSWVPPETMAEANRLSETEALALLPEVLRT